MSTPASAAPTPSAQPKRLLIVQFGSYAFAEHRFQRGEGETYYAQRYTVSYVADLARAGHAVRVVSLEDAAPLERLPSGVESVGIRLYPGTLRRARTRELIAHAEAWGPTHLLLHTPVTALMRWAVQRPLRTLVLIADSFCADGLRARRRYRHLASALNHPGIRWVANHGPNAAADLVRIGVDPHKVVPFDWPVFVGPAGLEPKSAPADPRSLQLLYVGLIIRSKGVGDIIEALALARRQGEHHRAVIVGTGRIEEFRRLARVRGVEDRVEFTGRVPHARVIELMNRADAVVVPSRHEYPEGMPMTVYEGLSSRTPVVISDHPMFRGRIEHRRSGMVFRAGDPSALLDTVHELCRDGELYERLSRQADASCAAYFGPLKWDQVISRWLSATPHDDEWLAQFALDRNAPAR